jgi:hypothetical protein
VLLYPILHEALCTILPEFGEFGMQRIACINERLHRRRTFLAVDRLLDDAEFLDCPRNGPEAAIAEKLNHRFRFLLSSLFGSFFFAIIVSPFLVYLFFSCFRRA